MIEWLSDRTAIEILIGVVAILLVIIVGILLYRRHRKIAKLQRWLRESTPKEREDYINDAIDGSGFLYDGVLDIFYADKNPWQKKYGYTKLYDEAAAAAGMVIDCEPIYFDYDGKKWMLELWKGQYGLCLGGEIGLYQASERDSSFFMGVEEADYIGMHMDLYVSGRWVFGRREDHWWLTGFVLGKNTKPKNIKMSVSLTFKDCLMRQRFLEGLRQTGYSYGEYQISGDSVRFWFANPHTRQPATRGPIRDRIRLWWLGRLCGLFRHLTRKYKTSAEKLIYLQTRAPWLFSFAIDILRGKKQFEKGRGDERIGKD